MVRDASDLAQRLGHNAEAVCREYLSNGRREGRYWLVGDVANTRGRSLFVRLSGPDHGKGAAGKWTDAATGEHGDLLDVIREEVYMAITTTNGNNFMNKWLLEQLVHLTIIQMVKSKKKILKSVHLAKAKCMKKV